MNIALWILAGAMTLAFLAAGFMKAFRPIAEVKKMPWAQPMSDAQIRAIGAAEILGALGLVIPQATGISTWLTPLAAICLAILMAGAAATHVRLKDPRSAAVTTRVLMAVLIVIAAGRILGLLGLF